MNHEPVIYFADSCLYLSDLIGGTKPVTNLIVLSACETAKGKNYDGEGVFNFNRGFAALGIPASVTNLWSVDNRSTYKITELFYKYISKGFPTDVALQKAKIEFIKTSDEQRLPYFWASAILVGKNSKLKNETTSSWQIVVLIVTVTTLLALLLYSKFFRRN
jgi:CHAT domain-containing protein